VSEFADYLQQHWTEECHNASRLYQEIRQKGYAGKHAMVRRFVSGWRKTGKATSPEAPQRVSPKHEGAKHSEFGPVVRFAYGLQKDISAVAAAVDTSWSTGQVEGQINRLKMIKRQMYGRAGFELLRDRVLPYSPATGTGPPP
jgi:transposase